MTQQVRIHKTDGGQSYRYFADVSSKRAAELAAIYCASECVAVDYLEVIDDCYDYDSDPDLIADWQGRPAITINLVQR